MFQRDYRSRMFQTDYRSRMFQRDYRSRMFRTTYRTKNVPEKRFIEENNVPDRQTDNLSQQKPKGSAKTIYRSKIFRTTYPMKKVSDRLRLCIGGKCAGQTIYRSSKHCEWKVTHKTRTDLFAVRLPLAVHGTQTKDSARATVTRTFLTSCHAKSCPE